MYTVTPLRIVALLLIYGALFVVFMAYRNRIESKEKKTYLVVAILWAVSVFIGNYVFYRIGIMSFLPWINNFMHTFIWIGGCLTFLYLAVRKKQPMWIQFILFATFSLVVKYAENLLFGTWDHDHFFWLFKGQTAYILGWSLMDGLYPPLTLFGLRLLKKWVSGLVVV